MLKKFAPWLALVVIAFAGCLAGCGHVAISRSGSSVADVGTWSAASHMGGATEMGEWEHYRWPRKKATQFSGQRLQGRDVIKAQAESSASMLRRKLRIEPENLGTLHFSWLVESLISDADMAQSAHDDAPVRIVLAFEGDRSQFSTRNALLSELSYTLTGEHLPYATLIYSWCVQCSHEDIIVNPRTDRVRTQVVEAGSHSLGQWKDYVRDIRADFQAAFGEPPGTLVAIGVMTDADNTRSHATAWYGPLQLVPQAPQAATP